VLVYNFSTKLNYSIKASFYSALIFSVLSCHAEALLFINCINELFSAVFILTGLFLFSKYNTSKIYFPVAMSFLFALLSRESAVCYIPLLFLVNYRLKLTGWKNIALITAVPVLIYMSFRIFSETYFPGSNLSSTIDSLDLNPVKIIYKMFHYFINMIIPVKVLFEFLGFGYLESLIAAFRKPVDNLFVFISLSLSALIICVSLIYFIFKTLRKEIAFPLMFIFFSIAIYFLSFNTAERFLYLPSAGLSILLGLFFSELKSTKILFLSFILFLLIHSASFLSRTYRHKQAANYSAEVMNDLYSKTTDIKNGDYILFENIPPKKFGIFFLSPYNFQSNWDYNFPDKKINFIFKETYKENIKDLINSVYKFSVERNEFERVK